MRRRSVPVVIGLVLLALLCVQAVRQAHWAQGKVAERIAPVLRQGLLWTTVLVAVQIVLTLVEPQSSGIGGGAFLLHWDGREVTALDGRETAPAAADERLFIRRDGAPL